MLFWQKIFGDSTLALKGVARYREIAEHARRPVFYKTMGVPDSLDGRFELLCLHAFLVFRHLKSGDRKAARLAQAIYDAMFQDLDAGLRELGAADIGVGRRIKAMTEGLNGRIRAYETGLGAGTSELRRAIERNVFGTVRAEPKDIDAISHYLEHADRALKVAGWEHLVDGPIRFPDPSTIAAEGRRTNAPD